MTTLQQELIHALKQERRSMVPIERICIIIRKPRRSVYAAMERLRHDREERPGPVERRDCNGYITYTLVG